MKKTLNFSKGLLKLSSIVNTIDLKDGHHMPTLLHGTEEVQGDRMTGGEDKEESPKRNQTKVGMDIIFVLGQI
jgi:hypothetical protein